jgi:hypothetical protein
MLLTLWLGRLLFNDNSFGSLLPLELSAHKALNQALLVLLWLSFALTGPPRRGQQYASSSYCYLSSFPSVGAAESLSRIPVMPKQHTP